MNKEKIKNLISSMAEELECDNVDIIDALYSHKLIMGVDADELEGLNKGGDFYRGIEWMTSLEAVHMPDSITSAAFVSANARGRRQANE